MVVDPMRVHEKWGIFDDSQPLEPGYSQCLWNVEARKMFKTKPDNQASTLTEILEKSKDKFGNRKAVGQRELLKTHMVPDSTGKLWEKLELRNKYTWLTYREYYDRVLNAARGLQMLGVGAKSKVVIYAETQRDWMVMAFAAWFTNAQVVTIYATLGADGATHGINETEATTVVTDAKLLKILAKVLPQCKQVKNIITMTDSDAELTAQIKESDIKIFSMNNFLDFGRTSIFHPCMPAPEDVAVIMYTSGTTGSPKGVIISHGNLVSTIAGVEHDLKGLTTNEDIYMAYLPLAHIMEMAAECCFLAMGAAIGFGTPSTLLSQGDAAKKLFTEPTKEAIGKNPELGKIKPRVEYSVGDAVLLMPTFMVFPPAVLDKLYQSVTAKFTEAKLGWLLRAGLRSGERHAQRGKVGANALLNVVFKKKVQSSVGGRLKAVISGSAPLSAEVQRFVQTVFAVPVRQGYGLTETCAGSAVAFWGDQTLRSVGPPTVNTTIRLADWQEGNYLVSDKEKPEIGVPRGEILIGGPGVASGYYISDKNPNEELRKKNSEDWVSIAGVRYFRTGDIGQVSSSGTLSIIDRKKDLWKGPNGEYVAFAKIEQALTVCPYVQLAMCYARVGSDYPVALICPQKPKILELGKELNVSGEFDVLCNDNRIVEAVHKVVVSTCQEQKLAAFEIPRKVALVSELWTPENELLTAAMKLKRPAIVAAHKENLDKMYAA
mmetsp:Transcript_50262/g.106799  ORF Transcript_50262/g.106799 Transcript_50262/m.106799 type:complete len:717 (+) Transcript_50262:103-2253(+)